MPIEAFGWFFLGAGFSALTLLGAALVTRYMRKRSAFKEYVSNLQDFSQQLEKASSQEVSELSFRDKEGKLCKVLIVVDHTLELSETDKEKLRATLQTDHGGSLDKLIASSQYEESDMKRVQQFVFSGHAVNALRERGMEPDDVVRKMLKAAGRIA